MVIAFRRHCRTHWCYFDFEFNLCLVSSHSCRIQLLSTVMPKRRQKYQSGPANYSDGLRRALTTSSNLTRQDVCDTAGATQSVRVYDASHLLVTEHFELLSGGTVPVQFFHPVRLVQQVLDNSPRLAEHYGKMALKHPQPWMLLFGCDEQTPGSKVNHDNRRKICAES